MNTVKKKRFRLYTHPSWSKEIKKELAKKNVPPEFDDVLGKVQKIDPRAIIAGGSVRDHHNDKPYKDLDIFVPAIDPADFIKIAEKLKVDFGEYTMKTKSSEDYEVLELVSVADYKVYGISVQLIGFKDKAVDQPQFTEAVLKTFDFGFNRIAYLGNKKFKFLRDYTYDKHMGLYTLRNVRAPYHLLKLVEKYKRINEKYDGKLSLSYTRGAFKGGQTSVGFI